MEGEIHEEAIGDGDKSDLRTNGRTKAQKRKTKEASTVVGSDVVGESAGVAGGKVVIENGGGSGAAKKKQRKGKEKGESGTSTSDDGAMSNCVEDGVVAGQMGPVLTGKEVKERCIIIQTHIASTRAHSPVNEGQTTQIIGESSLGSSCRKQKTKSPPGYASGAYWEAWRGWPYNSLLVGVVQNAGLNPLSVETVLLRVDGLCGTLGQCSGLLKKECPIDANYVRVAGLLYQKVWGSYFPHRSRRVFLDPAFGSTVIKLPEGGSVDLDLKRRWSSRLGCIESNWVNVIFVPVLENSHWWCAVFSLSGREIGIIDTSDSTGAHQVHNQAIFKLAKGLDELIAIAYPPWIDGQCASFRTYTVPVLAHDDMFHNGLEMLLATKRVAYCLHEEVHLGFVSEESRWLVHEDLMSRFNVERLNVLQLLQRRLKLILVCRLPRSMATFQQRKIIRCKYY